MPATLPGCWEIVVKAYIHLVDYVLERDGAVSVWDGEEWAVKRSDDRGAIIEAIEAVEEAEVRIYGPAGPRGPADEFPVRSRVGWAMVTPFGVDDGETVADCTGGQFMEDWTVAFEKVAA